jgi:hypothetical protein
VVEWLKVQLYEALNSTAECWLHGRYGEGILIVGVTMEVW